MHDHEETTHKHPFLSSTLMRNASNDTPAVGANQVSTAKASKSIHRTHIVRHTLHKNNVEAYLQTGMNAIDKIIDNGRSLILVGIDRCTVR